jgi:hypothetical protein
MFNQGLNYINSIKTKVTQGFTNRKREGFNGIIGNNSAMDEVIASDTAKTTARTTTTNNNIAQYGTDYGALKEKTKFYLNDSDNDYLLKKNYNVFINKSLTESQITATKQQSCVTADSINNLTPSAGFSEAYPANFTNYDKAETACRLWAADSGSTVYALNQDAAGKYICSTGSALNSTITQYTKPKTVYTVLTGDTSAIQGGLFNNGQIGVWAGSSATSGTSGTSAMWNTSNMKKPMMIKKFNNSTYASSETPFTQSIQQGWWGLSNPPAPNNTNKTNWGVNMFPNDIAWWIGNLPGANTPTASVAYNGVDGTTSYFYYVYNAPRTMPIYIYAVFPASSTILKRNGIYKSLTPYNGDWVYGGSRFTTLRPGKNVFEISSPTGLPASGFVFYVATADKSTVLFKSGDPGWGVTTTAVSDYKLITSGGDTDQTDIKTLNAIPTGYTNCGRILGGSINKASITASYGRNCSNVTNPPLMVRYVTVNTNSSGDYIQISQIAVNALVGGKEINVAPLGTATGSPTWGNGTVPITAIDGNLSARAYPAIYHSGWGVGKFWKLDLGKDYPVTQIIYYNRADCCQFRSIGMQIVLSANNGTVYPPIILTDALVQSFNASTQRTA